MENSTYEDITSKGKENFINDYLATSVSLQKTQSVIKVAENIKKKLYTPLKK